MIDYSKIKYINLHNHTTYSLLDGVGTVEEHIESSFKNGHCGCCITDHGVMNGVVELFLKSKDKKFLNKIGYGGEKFPVVLGAELYIIDDINYRDKKTKYHHITIFAKNEIGFRNLSKLTSIGTMDDHFYTRPRISLKELIEHKDGLIITSGCFLGYVPQAIFQKKGVLKNIFYKIINGEKLTDLESEILSFEEIDNDIAYIKENLLVKENVHLFSNEIIKENLEEKIDALNLKKEIVKKLKNIIYQHSAENLFSFFKNHFGEDFYVEFHLSDLCMKWNSTIKKYEDTKVNVQKMVNLELVELANKNNVKIVISQDSHMPQESDHILQSILIWNSPSGKDGWHFYHPYNIMDLKKLHFKFLDMYPEYADFFEEWVSNPYDVLEKCLDLKINKDLKLPKVNLGELDINRDTIINEEIRKVLIKNKKFDFETYIKIIKNEIDDLNFPEKIKDFMKQNSLVENKLKYDLEEKINALSIYFKEHDNDLFLLLNDGDDRIKSIMRIIIKNESLFPKEIDKDKLRKIIKKQFKNKDIKNFKGRELFKIINSYHCYKIDKDPTLIFGKKNYKKRLIEEINFLKEEKLLDFFLFIYDIISFVKLFGKYVGIGRGSASSSLLSYAMGLTYVDPVENKLIFDRFLSKERLNLGQIPDFDLDTNGRDLILSYLKYIYGNDYVGVFPINNKIPLIKSIRDVLYYKSKNSNEKIAEIISDIEQYLKRNRYDKLTNEVFDEYLKNTDYGNYFNNENVPLMKKLSNNVRIITKHPVGITVLDKEIYKETPATNLKGEWLIQTDYENLESFGFIKYDILPLHILDVVEETMSKIDGIDFYKIPQNNFLVLKQIVDNDFKGIFQLDSEITKKICRKLKKINSVNDISVIIGLSRPGVIKNNIEKVFLERINNDVYVDLPEQFHDILFETYGLIIYQEQFMSILRLLKYSEREVFLFLNKIKGKSEFSDEEKKDIFERISKLKVESSFKDDLFDSLIKSVGYLFPKAHSIAYATLIYNCLWLKKFYPREFKSSFLNQQNKGSFIEYFNTWDDLFYPNINKSKDFYNYDNDKIYLPLNEIDGLTNNAIKTIIKNQPYISFDDFMEKNKNEKTITDKVIEKLIFAGTFDCFIVDENNSDFRKKIIKKITKDYNNFKKEDFLIKQIELLKITNFDYIKFYADLMQKKSKEAFSKEALSPRTILKQKVGDIVVIGGIIEDFKVLAVRSGVNKGKEMAKFNLINKGERVSVVIYSDEFAMQKDRIFKEVSNFTPIVVKGKVSEFNNEKTITFLNGLV